MIQISPIRTLVLALLAACGTAAAQETPASQPAPVRKVFFEKADTPLPPEVYCRIDGQPVLRAQFGDWLQKYFGDDYIQSYVTGMLIRKAASDGGVSVTPQEIDQVIERDIEGRALAAYRGRRELFIEQELTRFGRTLELYKMQRGWNAETDLLTTKLLKRRRLTTDADIEKEFRRLYGTSGREIGLRAILVEISYPPVTSFKSVEEKDALVKKALEEAYNKCIKIVKAIQAGSTDFQNAALAYSDDFESKRKGGDIGVYINDPPEFGAEFDALIHKAKPGQMVGPIRARAGFIIAEITKETPHDLRKEREAIRKELVEREPTTGETQTFIRELLLGAKLVR